MNKSKFPLISLLRRVVGGAHVLRVKLEQTIMDPGIDVSNKLRKIEKMESLLPSSGNTKVGVTGVLFFAKLFPT